jgi:hypothetical protein
MHRNQIEKNKKMIDQVEMIEIDLKDIDIYFFLK